jgi:esterase/lipase superfamily enzyme
MDMLVYGHSGKPVLFFPTRTARYYDYEDWNTLIKIEQRIDSGEFQLYCLDSVDADGLYNKHLHPSLKIRKHLLYEAYVLDEVLRFVNLENPGYKPIVAGCSLGAWHAANLTFRHPHLFSHLLAMSGRYDLTMKLEFFEDLFDGYRDDDIYYHMPNWYIPNITDATLLDQLRALHIVIVIGREDAFLPNNQHLNAALLHIGVPHNFQIWEGEAHKARYWAQMLEEYL